MLLVWWFYCLIILISSLGHSLDLLHNCRLGQKKTKNAYYSRIYAMIILCISTFCLWNAVCLLCIHFTYIPNQIINKVPINKNMFTLSCFCKRQLGFSSSSKATIPECSHSFTGSVKVSCQSHIWQVVSFAGEIEQTLCFPVCNAGLPPGGNSGDCTSSLSVSRERRMSTLCSRTPLRTFCSSWEKRPRTCRSTDVLPDGLPIPTRSLGITWRAQDRQSTILSWEINVYFYPTLTPPQTPVPFDKHDISLDCLTLSPNLSKGNVISHLVIAQFLLMWEGREFVCVESKLLTSVCRHSTQDRTPLWPLSINNI